MVALLEAGGGRASSADGGRIPSEGRLSPDAARGGGKGAAKGERLWQVVQRVHLEGWRIAPASRGRADRSVGGDHVSDVPRALGLSGAAVEMLKGIGPQGERAVLAALKRFAAGERTPTTPRPPPPQPQGDGETKQFSAASEEEDEQDEQEAHGEGQGGGFAEPPSAAPAASHDSAHSTAARQSWADAEEGLVHPFINVIQALEHSLY